MKKSIRKIERRTCGRDTGAQTFGAETLVTTERNSHMIEPFMDSLALQALIYRMNDTLVANDAEGRMAA